MKFVEADLSKVDDCRKVIAEADKAFRRVDVLVNVAANTHRGTILDTSPELFDDMFAVNARAPFFLIQEAAKVMRREKIEGTVVNIQSMSAHGGQPFISAYCMSKAALATLTRNAAFSLMPDHIRVNGLNIGWMDTPGEDTIQMRYHTDDKDWLKKAEAKQPFGRLLKPTEVARAVAYLASDEFGADDRGQHRLRSAGDWRGGILPTSLEKARRRLTTRARHPVADKLSKTHDTIFQIETPESREAGATLSFGRCPWASSP